MIPRPFIYAAIAILVLAMVPPAIIARARAKNSAKTRVHLVQDMDNQAKFRAQQVNPLFADDRAMRPPVEGTVARGHLDADDHFHRGVDNDAWATTFPRQVYPDVNFMRHGRERFNIFCQPCHGAAGYGDGIVHKRAQELLENPLIGNGTTWVAPKSLHEQAIRDQPVGQVFNTITNGVRNMAGYASQIPVADRWAIVAYIKALQRSQNARETDVPPDVYRQLPAPEPLSETPSP